MSLSDDVRTAYRHLQSTELVHKAPDALLGVTQDAVAALKLLGIETVFDLATSAVFATANQLVAAADDPRSYFAQYGAASSDAVDKTAAAGKKVDELQSLPIDALAAVPRADAAAIAAALDANDVRALALYPPYRTARRVLDEAFFPDNVATADPERPADLLPRSGEYPTERVQYTSLLMDSVHGVDGAALVDVRSQAFRPLSLDTLANGKTGFATVAFGALLTFNQSWYAQGVTLGQLLHSTALAPGESTRIAVVDWSRRSRAGQTDLVEEDDQLANDASHTRAISEVTSAVATEAQSGFSGASSTSVSTQTGIATAAELSSPLGGLLGGISGSMGATSSFGTGTTTSSAYSSSFGRRDVASSMMQNVNDRTHQHAHSSRSRRASVVKEVSQNEHENVSTRVIANYNHMHAMTVQYYEVVQIYRVEVALAKAERVVFVPLALLDFTRADTVRRFQAVLAANALSFSVRESLMNFDVLELAPHSDSRFPRLDATLSLADVATAWRTRPPLAQPGPIVKPTVAPAVAAGADAATPAAASPVGAAATLGPRFSVAQRIADNLWSQDQVSRVSNLLGLGMVRAYSPSAFLPTDVAIESVGVAADGAPVNVVLHRRNGTAVTPALGDAPVAMVDISSIGVSGSSPERDVTATVTLTLNRHGVLFPVELPSVHIPRGGTTEVTVVDVKTGGVNTNLTAHLVANQLHYSQAVFRSLDAAQLALLLSGLGVVANGATVPVAQVIEPVPIAFVGNYLAFKMNYDPDADPEWKRWIEEHNVKIGSVRQDLVPLGTGGVFAEAVLGRSNAAEKLDITRFWNWQDSPIPLQPTEIAAIQTGTRQSAEDTRPGQLSNPIVNITNPTGLPDPAGTAAVLAAIQNGNMFRDMSGLQGAIGLAQAALNSTAAGAASAGQQAGTNMDNLLKANTERQRIAADMIKSLAQTVASAYTGHSVSGGAPLGAAASSSEQGAKINYFDRNGSGSSGGEASGSAAGGTAGGAVPAGGGGTNGSAGPAGVTPVTNPAALQSVWGDSQSPSQLVDRLLTQAAGSDTSAPEPTAPLSTRKAWPKLDPALVLPRIHELATNPDLFNQGAVGLCTAAAFFHHVLQRKGPEFETFAKELFGSGIGFLGDLKIAPDSDLRNADYSSLQSKYNNFPPQGDWMVMSSLRDSENWFFDFEGSPDEDIAIATSAKEMADWYRKTGFYTNVTFSDDDTVGGLKAIAKTPANQIALWINARLLINVDAGHMITLEGPFTIDEANDRIEFDYWTWGHGKPDHMNTTLSKFVANYSGAIVATI